jgi:hypothetical protein
MLPLIGLSSLAKEALQKVVLGNQMPSDAPSASFMGTSCLGMSRPLTACHATLPATLYTHEGSNIHTSALVDCGAISNYLLQALFGFLGTPVTCSYSSLILAANCHVISHEVEETAFMFHFNLIDDITKKHKLLHMTVAIESLSDHCIVC